MISRLTFIAALGGLAAAVSAAPDQSGIPLPQYHIFAGNTHSHTTNTWSHGEHYGTAAPKTNTAAQRGAKAKVLRPDWQKYQGSPGAHYALAKSKGYDFYVTTDHSKEAAFQPPGANNTAWLAAKRDAATATDTNFVAVAGFEHSQNSSPSGSGHINVFNSREYPNALSPEVDLPFLYRWLTTARPNGDGPVVASFNHPAPRGYGNWAWCNPQVTDVLTLLEVINSNNRLHYEAFVNALDKGWKVSPVCGNDNHGFWGITRHTSRTFVLATARTKPAILEAMKQRRTYASLEGNLQCRYTVNGTSMGSTLNRQRAFQFDIAISDPDRNEPADKITRIDIVKDGGAVVEECEPTPAYSISWRPSIQDATNRYFFVRVWNAGGGDAPGAKPDKPVAWLAPVWTGR